MDNINKKQIIVVLDKSKQEVFDAIKSVLADVQFVQKYENFEQVLTSGTVLSSSTLRINKTDGINYKRESKKMLLLCDKEMLDEEYIINIRKTYGKYFDLYVETIDEIYTYIKKCELDTFAFRNYIYELFKNYKDIDYLII